MEQIIKNNPIIAILRNLPLDKTIRYVEAAHQGGIHAFEVALNSKDALRQIKLIRHHFGDEVTVGAGTVISVERACNAVSVGAEFMLSPSADQPVLEFCRKHEIPLLPGVMTPSDVSICVNWGFRTLKLFPAGDLPLSYIKSLQGPFDDTSYVAVGGVGADNIRQFFDHGFVGVGIGGKLIPKELVQEDRWEEAAQHVRELVRKSL